MYATPPTTDRTPGLAHRFAALEDLNGVDSDMVDLVHDLSEEEVLSPRLVDFEAFRAERRIVPFPSEARTMILLRPQAQPAAASAPRRWWLWLLVVSTLGLGAVACLAALVVLLGAVVWVM